MTCVFRSVVFATSFMALNSDAALLDNDAKRPSTSAYVQALAGHVKKPGMEIGFDNFDENHDGKMNKYEYVFALVNRSRAKLQQEQEKMTKREAKEVRARRCEAENKRSKTEKTSKVAEAEHKVLQTKMKAATKQKKTADEELHAAKGDVKETLRNEPASHVALAEGPSDDKDKFVQQCTHEEREGATMLKVEEAIAAVSISNSTVEDLQGELTQLLNIWAKEKIRHREEIATDAKILHNQTEKDLATKRMQADEAEKNLEKQTEALQKLR